MRRRTRKAKQVAQNNISRNSSTTKSIKKDLSKNSENSSSNGFHSDSDKQSTNSNSDTNDRLIIDEQSRSTISDSSQDNLQITSFPSTSNSYLFIELKLISIDFSCTGYNQLSQNHLCLNSNATASHLKSFIHKKTAISQDIFEVNLFCALKILIF